MDTKSRIPVEGSRTAPAALIAQLREIDPRAELIDYGQGRWYLGVYNPNRARVEAAQRRLAFLTRFPQAPADDVVYDRLAAAGFRPIECFRIQGEPGAEIVRWFRRADWVWRHQADEHFAERMRHSTGDHFEEKRTKKIHDFLDAVGPDADRRFRNPVSVTVN
jgi:hypothetical protein